MIECKFREKCEFEGVVTRKSNKKRKGIYSSSVSKVRGFGRSKWVIIAHIDVNYEKYIEEGLSENEIFQGCIDYLNQPPPRKKYAKKKPRPLYGKLEPYRAKFKKDENGNFIEAEIITDQRKNKNFWGEGIKIGQKILSKMPSKLKKA